MHKWFTVKNGQTAGVLDVSIHDEIGIWGVSAKDFIKEISEAKAVREINLSIHSPGGNAFDGLAMYHALQDHAARVNAKVEGVAASAATIVLMAGDVISMPEDTFLMIHNPWSFAMGDADDMRDAAEFLDKVKGSLVNIYAKRTGMDDATISELLDEETWLTANEAKEYGFVDVVSNKAKVAALTSAFAKHFAHVPASIAPACKSYDDEKVAAVNDERSFERLLRDAGVSRKLASAAVSKAKELFGVDPAADSDATAVTEMVMQKAANLKATNLFRRYNHV